MKHEGDGLTLVLMDKELALLPTDGDLLDVLLSGLPTEQQLYEHLNNRL
jgi:hypothetical protein